MFENVVICALCVRAVRASCACELCGCELVGRLVQNRRCESVVGVKLSWSEFGKNFSGRGNTTTPGLFPSRPGFCTAFLNFWGNLRNFDFKVLFHFNCFTAFQSIGRITSNKSPCLEVKPSRIIKISFEIIFLVSTHTEPTAERQPSIQDGKDCPPVRNRNVVADVAKSYLYRHY